MPISDAHLTYSQTLISPSTHPGPAQNPKPLTIPNKRLIADADQRLLFSSHLHVLQIFPTPPRKLTPQFTPQLTHSIQSMPWRTQNRHGRRATCPTATQQQPHDSEATLTPLQASFEILKNALRTIISLMMIALLASLIMFLAQCGRQLME